MPPKTEAANKGNPLSSQTMRGGGFLAARYGLGVLVSVGNMLVLTWWIGPHAYGLFVTAIGLVAFLSTLGRAGVDTYLVRCPCTPSKQQYEIASTLIFSISLGLTILGAAFVPVLAAWYGSREFVAPYLILLLNIPVIGMIGLPIAKLERELNFVRVAGIELGGQAIGLLLSVSIAWRGGGIWAPVAGQLAWQIFILIASCFAANLLPRFRYERRAAKEMLSYGLGLTASLRIWQLRTLVNPLLVGRFMGPEGVAFVGLAIRIAESLGSVRLAAGRVAIAALSRLQGCREEFQAALGQALYVQVITLGPLLCAFVLLGPFTVHHVIGERWTPSLAVYPFIAAGVLVNSIYNLQASALFVLGKQWLVLRAYGVHVVLLALATLFLVPRIGIVGYGWAELLACAAYPLLQSEGACAVRYRALLPWIILFLAILFAPANWRIAVAATTILFTAWAMFWKYKPLPILRRVIVALSGLLMAANFVAAQSAIPAQYFGMHWVRSQPWPTVRFGSLRLWDTDTRWQQMNPAPGVFDFSNLDAYLATAKTHGVEDVVLVLSATPNWISSDPANAFCDYANTANGSCAPPSDLNADGAGANQAWRDFIYRLASHVAGLSPDTYSKLSAYEMWNEFSRNTESWTGTHAQMVRMAQDAFCILKGTGTITATGESCTAQHMKVAAVGLAPAAFVLSPSVQLVPDVNFLGAYLASPGAADAANVIATHNYTYCSSCCASAENLTSQWTALRAVLTGGASNLPVWSTEGSWGDTATKEPDTDMQSAYVARAHLLGWSLGWKRTYWYAWGNSWGRLWSQSGVNGCSDGGSGAGCLSPAATAYATVYLWMVGNIMTQPCTSAGTIYSCELTTASGAKTLAVWDAARSCASGVCDYSSYKLPAGYACYFDLANVLHNPAGKRKINIGAKPILLASSCGTAGVMLRAPQQNAAYVSTVNSHH